MPDVHIRDLDETSGRLWVSTPPMNAEKRSILLDSAFNVAYSAARVTGFFVDSIDRYAPTLSCPNPFCG